MSDESSAIIACFDALRTAAATSFQRRLLWLCGEAQWCRTQAALIASAEPWRWLWVGCSARVDVTRIDNQRATTYLGGEWEGLIYDAHAGFDPDALGAVSGTLRGGGILVLLTPPSERWPASADPEKGRIAIYPYAPEAISGHYIRRLATLLAADTQVMTIIQGAPLPPPPLLSHSPKVQPFSHPECRTVDQLAAVEAVLHVVSGHRRRPLVLTADRGRGKSAALGIAAAHLLGQGVRRIFVTAPRLEATATLFAHTERCLPTARRHRSHLLHGDGVLEFISPDRLLTTDCHGDLLLVDEAAAIPIPLLERMVADHSRIVFASTIHGYEGSGRGFGVHFQRHLDAHTPGWKALHMETPVRWAADDPLEALIFRALLLNAEPVERATASDCDPKSCAITRCDRQMLATDEVLLGQLFGLLVTAHYRTSPLDLRHLLDGPNVQVWLAQERGAVLGVLLATREGGFDEALAQAVWAGERRPRGHLIPQSLAAHVGLPQAPLAHGLRIMRIAVHPALRGRGLGRRMVKTLATHAEGCDYLGSSFGATEGLLRFWHHCGMEPVRVGLSRNHTSGAHAVLVICPLTATGVEIAHAARHRFRASLPHLLLEPLRNLEPPLASLLCAAAEWPLPDLAPEEQADWSGFATARRDYVSSLPTLWKVALWAVGQSVTDLTRTQRDLLVMKVVQKRSWGESVAALALSGRSEAVEVLRGAYAVLLARYGASVQPKSIS